MDAIALRKEKQRVTAPHWLWRLKARPGHQSPPQPRLRKTWAADQRIVHLKVSTSVSEVKAFENSLTTFHYFKWWLGAGEKIGKFKKKKKTKQDHKFGKTYTGQKKKEKRTHRRILSQSWSNFKVILYTTRLCVSNSGFTQVRDHKIYSANILGSKWLTAVQKSDEREASGLGKINVYI